ncbi:MAG: EpsI family protein [Planctomycetota bacterium]
MRRGVILSGVLLWLAAPALLFLSWHRPFTTSIGRAARVPLRIGGFVQTSEDVLTPRERELLGTDDATWRTYRDADGHEVYVVAVFHQHNWKSVHPPHLCLRGSDMTIEHDGETEPLAVVGGTDVRAGRIATRARGDGRPYLSLYVYGAGGLRTGSYSTFVWHHLPRAVLRRDSPGFLLRVEAWRDEGDAEARCRAFLRAAVPVLEGLLP